MSTAAAAAVVVLSASFGVGQKNETVPVSVSWRLLFGHSTDDKGRLGRTVVFFWTVSYCFLLQDISAGDNVCLSARDYALQVFKEILDSGERCPSSPVGSPTTLWRRVGAGAGFPALVYGI